MPLSDYALSLLRGAYFGTLLGGLIFFLVWEGGAPRIAFADSAARHRHVLRNLVMFGLVVLIADLLVGTWLLETNYRIGAPAPGLLAPLELGWVALLLVGIPGVDLLMYGWHRACHAVPWLWRIHRVHHSDTHLDASTGTRFHALETSLAIMLTVAAMDAAGIPLWVELVRTIIVNPLLLAQHANLVYPAWLERFGGPLFVTPDFHRVHHATVRSGQDANFGQLFSFWDRLFGTWRTPRAGMAAVGVDGMDAERYQSALGMCATPFLRDALPGTMQP